MNAQRYSHFWTTRVSNSGMPMKTWQNPFDQGSWVGNWSEFLGFRPPRNVTRAMIRQRQQAMQEEMRSQYRAFQAMAASQNGESLSGELPQLTQQQSEALLRNALRAMSNDGRAVLAGDMTATLEHAGGGGGGGGHSHGGGVFGGGGHSHGGGGHSHGGHSH